MARVARAGRGGASMLGLRPEPAGSRVSPSDPRRANCPLWRQAASLSCWRSNLLQAHVRTEERSIKEPEPAMRRAPETSPSLETPVGSETLLLPGEKQPDPPG